jgi:hypothetical protein
LMQTRARSIPQPVQLQLDLRDVSPRLLLIAPLRWQRRSARSIESRLLAGSGASDCRTIAIYLLGGTHESAFCKRGSVNVRFAPKATEVLCCRELTGCAQSRPNTARQNPCLFDHLVGAGKQGGRLRPSIFLPLMHELRCAALISELSVRNCKRALQKLYEAAPYESRSGAPPFDWATKPTKVV